MSVYSAALMALSLCLTVASAQSQPRAAIITGEVHNPPSREIEFRHEPLLAPGPSEHYIVLDEQKSGGSTRADCGKVFAGMGR